MDNRNKQTITINIRQRTIVRPLNHPVTIWCKHCERESAMTTPEQAAHFFGRRTRDIYREIESGTLHFTELTDGELLVCCATAN